jgi:hypothetical protein
VSDLYDTDPHAWAMEQADQARLLAREHPDLGLDWPHLIEELDLMAGTDRAYVVKMAWRIMQHLLMIEHSPAAEPKRHWRHEVDSFRADLAASLTTTLRQHLAAQLDDAYATARKLAAKKMKLYGEDASGLPDARPYTLDQVLDLDWPPEE